MKSKNIFGVIALLIIGTVFGALLVSGFGFVRPSLAEVKIGQENPPIESINPQAEAFNDAFIAAAEIITPSIVQIRVISSVATQPNDVFKFFFPFRDDVPRERQGGGSGVIISGEGYILTNNHVVDNATRVDVTLHDNREFNAEVIGTDPLTDLAVIKINAGNLKVAYLGNSENIKVGQWVMAIGNPLSLTSTVTAGIISAVGRSLNIIQDSYGVENFIQTDAAINPGNSGGALVDLHGAVIGINSAIATNGFTSNYIGYGFAIPINLAKNVAQDLITNGKVTRGYIGVRIEAVSSDLANAVGLDKPKGVLIQQVMEDGAASASDIVAGDIILSVESKEVNQPNELQSYIASKRAGDEVKLTIFRDGKTITRTVILKAREKDEQTASVSRSSKDKDKNEPDIVEKNFAGIGLTIKNLSSNEYEKFKVEHGVIITDVKQFSKADNQRLSRGVIITEVDRKAIDSISEFEDAVNVKRGSAVLLKVVYKDGTTRFVGLDIPE